MLHLTRIIFILTVVISSFFWVTILWGEAAKLQSVEALLSVLKSTDLSHKDKWEAVQEIRQHGHNATFGLLKLLETCESDAIYYAIRALSYIRDPNSTGALSKILLTRSYGPRRYAAIALGQIGDPRAVNSLKMALADVDYVREDALNALIKINNDEANDVLKEYHFAKASSDLKLLVSLNKSHFSLGEQFEIKVCLINMQKNPITLIRNKSANFGYLVFQRNDGSFIEKVQTEMRERDKIIVPSFFTLGSNEKLDYSFIGNLEMWKYGEKDDHAFIESNNPFLTLKFRHFTYHVRDIGQFQVRVVFKQDDELLHAVDSMGVSKDKLGQVWIGKVISNPATFSVNQ